MMICNVSNDFALLWSLQLDVFLGRHKTRLHIGQLVKETSATLREASEADQDAEVSVSSSALYFVFFTFPKKIELDNMLVKRIVV